MRREAASSAGPVWLADTGDGSSPVTLSVTLILAAALHALLLFAVSFKLPDPPNAQRSVRPLEVVVLRHAAPTDEIPDKADAHAQVDRVGSGTDSEHNVTDSRPVEQTPELLPLPPDLAPAAMPEPPPPPEPTVKAEPPLAPEPLPEAAPVPEPESLVEPEPAPETALTATIEEPEPIQPPPPEPLADPLPPPKPAVTAAQILASRNTEIAKLTAKIEQDTSAYANRPRRKAISASTREYKYASYLEAWRRKVEQVGNLNYPEEAKRQRLYGNLILHVALRSDGSLEDVRVLRSSGYEVLDQAAVRIVELAAPFSPFSQDIKAETDILDITRTWQFLSNNRLGWEN